VSGCLFSSGLNPDKRIRKIERKTEIPIDFIFKFLYNLSFTVKMIKKHPLIQYCQWLAGVVFRRKVVVYLHLFFILQNFFDLGLSHNLFT
jgi:hypothetical protein